MSTFTVTIAPDGTPSPAHVRVRPGDTVSFHAAGADVVLCVDPAQFFGAERYEIPEGETEHLTVQAGAPASFEYITKVGDLDAPCRGGREKGSGGGGGLD